MKGNCYPHISKASIRGHTFCFFKENERENILSCNLQDWVRDFRHWVSMRPICQIIHFQCHPLMLRDLIDDCCASAIQQIMCVYIITKIRNESTKTKASRNWPETVLSFNLNKSLNSEFVKEGTASTSPSTILFSKAFLVTWRW